MIHGHIFIEFYDQNRTNKENHRMRRMGARIFTIFLVLFAIGSSAAFAKENTYKIGPGDSLLISVWKDENLTREIIVPPDGIISFPLIGSIDVTELTVEELKKIVTEKLKVYVTDATVTVILLEAKSLVAYVVGKVTTPGQFTINMKTTVMQVLAMAGDLDPFASPNDIIILRQEGDQSIQIPFHYNDVKKGKNLEQNIFLKRGDVIVVP